MKFCLSKIKSYGLLRLPHLRANLNSDSNGIRTFQNRWQAVRVQTGDVIDVECINTLEEGAEASFDQVLMVENDGKVTVGTPMVEGATVSAKVVSQFRGKKIIAFKFKRRKGFHKKKGSRRAMTKLEITAINA